MVHYNPVPNKKKHVRKDKEKDKKKDKEMRIKRGVDEGKENVTL